MKLSDEARAALAEIGRQGGKAKGAVKRRPAAHYKRLADMKRKKAKK